MRRSGRMKSETERQIIRGMAILTAPLRVLFCARQNAGR